MQLPFLKVPIGSLVRATTSHSLPRRALAHNHLEWNPYQATSYVKKGRFDRQDLEVTISLRRIPTYFVWNVYVILFLMPTISFLAYTVPAGRPDDDGPSANDYVDGFEARCQITLTLMLTSVAYVRISTSQFNLAPASLTPSL